MAKAIRGSDTERIKELSQQLDLNRIYIEDITFLELAMAEGKKAQRQLSLMKVRIPL